MKGHKFSVILPDKLHRRLKSAVKGRNFNCSDLARQFLTEGLARLESGGETVVNREAIKYLMTTLNVILYLVIDNHNPADKGYLSESARKDLGELYTRRARARSERVLKGMSL